MVQIHSRAGKTEEKILQNTDTEGRNCVAQKPHAEMSEPERKMFCLAHESERLEEAGDVTVDE